MRCALRSATAIQKKEDWKTREAEEKGREGKRREGIQRSREDRGIFFNARFENFFSLKMYDLKFVDKDAINLKPFWKKQKWSHLASFFWDTVLFQYLASCFLHWLFFRCFCHLATPLPGEKKK